MELEGNDGGVILCQGGKFGGWALYMDQGKPAYTYNWFGLASYTITAPEAHVGMDESTQVADKVFEDVDDSDFTGTVVEVTIAIPERK